MQEYIKDLLLPHGYNYTHTVKLDMYFTTPSDNLDLEVETVKKLIASTSIGRAINFRVGHN